ncbi:MAG: hypothetical protein ACREF3_01150, partial [Acetobacteraceae bacterium]
PKPPEVRPTVHAPVVVAAMPRPSASEPRPRPAIIRAAERPVMVPRPVMPVEARYAPAAMRPPPITGSLLGMAHSQSVSLPAPMPIPDANGPYGNGN